MKMLLIFTYLEKVISISIFALFLFPSNLCSQASDLKKVTFLPSWFPQTQFAGYYMAKEKGIYEKYKLDVTIKQGGFSQPVMSSLKSGEVDFGILFLFTGVSERAKGIKIVNIGQIFQQSSIMFVAKKTSRINSLKDFNKKRIGVWRTVATELTTGFLKKHNIDAEIVQFDKGINPFLKDAVDVMVVMEYNEYHRLLNSGLNADEINEFYFRDYDMNFPEDGIYCMESTYKNDPDLCRRFIDASMEGWDYAFANANETLDVMSKYKALAKVPDNRAHSFWMLSAMKNMVYPKDKEFKPGVLSKPEFENVINFLFNNKFIATKPLFGDFFKSNK